MKNFSLTIFLIIGSIFYSFAQEIVPNQVLVKITDEVAITDIIQKSNSHFGEEAEIRSLRSLSKRMNIWLIGHNDQISSEQLVDQLYFYSGVLDAQLNHKVKLRETVPNDPEYGTQWQHQNIDSELAWDLTTGGMTGVGDEIVVCVIEGGNAQHPDLIDNCWRNQAEIPDNGIDDDGNGYVDDYDGWNVQSENDEGVFTGNHGTSVMGMIGAKGNNELGVTGANWNVKIMSVAGENLNDEASLVEAYDYPYNMRMLYEENNGGKGAFVVATNASWGIDQGNAEDSPIWCGIYQTLGEGGILNCGATSNNDNLNIDVVSDLPTGCSSDYMISVTSTNVNDQRFGAYGATTVDFGAPGHGIYTTSGSNNYTSTNGTSFASPLTAGVIALLYSAPCEGLGTLSHEDPQAAADLVRQVLFDGVDIVDNLIGETVTGGRINAYNSLLMLLEVCTSGECNTPFSTNLNTEDNLSYQVSWNSFNSDNMYDIRYRAVGSEDWSETLGVADNTFDFGELEWCTEYEYQIKVSCLEDESEWASYNTFTTDGCCVAPAVGTITSNILGNDEVQISWESILAAESYNLIYTAPDGTSETVSNIDGLNATINGLETCTDYQLVIESSCASEVSENAPSTNFTTGCAHCTEFDFCESTGENSSDEWLEYFNIGTYQNTSGNNGGYALFTDGNIELNRGNLVGIQLAPGYTSATYDQSFAIWIDINQDGDFTEEELVYHNPENDQPIQTQITIPMEAELGYTRMRVSMIFIQGSNESTPPQASCGDFNFGEVEDYCVRITEFDPNNISEIDLGAQIFPNPVNDELTVLIPEINSSTRINLLDATGRIILSESAVSGNNIMNTAKLTPGTYFVEIRNNSGQRSKSKLVKL